MSNLSYTVKTQLGDFEPKLSLFRQNKVVNWHEHVWFDGRMELDEGRCDGLIEDMEKSYTDLCVVSLPLLAQKVTPEEFIHNNDTVVKALKKYPKQLRGFAYVNSGYAKEALAEIDRCVNEFGMIGIELYYQYFISDPCLHSVIEKCIDLDIPILVHASKLNYHPWEQPFVSNGIHFAEAAKKYPEAKIIMAHIGGGGDWEWSLKAIEDSPSIYMDVSGSVCENPIIERSVQAIGAKRMLYGTDGSFSSCMGKMLGAKISEADKIEILNNSDFERYLTR